MRWKFATVYNFTASCSPSSVSVAVSFCIFRPSMLKKISSASFFMKTVFLAAKGRVQKTQVFNKNSALSLKNWWKFMFYGGQTFGFLAILFPAAAKSTKN
jgi:hypothetical protein